MFLKNVVPIAVANGGTIPPTITAAIKIAAVVECGSLANAPDAKTYAALLKGPPISIDIIPAKIVVRSTKLPVPIPFRK